MPKSVAWRDASSVRAASGVSILYRFGDQPIQSAGGDIGLKLAIPFFGVELGKPGAERGAIFGGQLLDGFFELLDGAQDLWIARIMAGGNLR